MEPLETTSEAISAALKFIAGEGSTEPLAVWWDREAGTVVQVQHPDITGGKPIEVEGIPAELSDPIGRNIELVETQLHGALLSGRLESFVYDPDSEMWRRLTASGWFGVRIKAENPCFLGPGEEAAGPDLPMAGQPVLLSRSAVREWIANTFEQQTELEAPNPQVTPDDLRNSPATKRAKGGGNKPGPWTPMLIELVREHHSARMRAIMGQRVPEEWPTSQRFTDLLRERSGGRFDIKRDTVLRRLAIIKREYLG